MTSIAILIGNSRYKHADDLECCLEDLKAMQALVLALDRHTVAKAVSDVDADGMRSALREALADLKEPDEVFFYFSGHGALIGSEFYFCGTTFDRSRPNETGLSHGELHEMLKRVQPQLLVKVVDACSSGTPLIKADPPQVPMRKDGLRDVVQISSCMNDQSSWAGEPLSVFTEAFCRACLRREEGPVFWGDVINTLRDDFLNDDEQTPFFVHQGNNRETLVDDAATLAGFRAFFEQLIDDDQDQAAPDDDDEILLVSEPTTLDLLSRAERRMITPDKANRLVASILDPVKERLGRGELAEMFKADVQEHTQFRETTAHDFAGRILAREDRPDDLVHASVRRTVRDASSTAALASTLASLYGNPGGPTIQEHVTFRLNCTLERAQMKVTLTPLYQSLQRMVLVLTCAPSLERCYLLRSSQNTRGPTGTATRKLARRWSSAGTSSTGRRTRAAWSTKSAHHSKRLCGRTWRPRRSA